MLKTIAAMALFVPGNPGLWLTPGSVLGLVAGVMLWLPLARLTAGNALRAATLSFVAAAVLVNLAPENPYLVAALQVLQHGQYLRFNSMIALLSSLWTILVFAYLAFALRGGDAQLRADDRRAP
jgi:ABC-type dipeptide/oligopeptide/nickel transport system permease subunit